MKKIILFIVIFLNMTACENAENITEGKIKEFHEAIKVQHSNKMGISIYYAEKNIPKPTIYFLSASISDRRVYKHIYYYFVNKGYTVIGISTEGFASDFMTYHYYNAISYARKICKEKNISNEKKIGLAGHSSGAGFLPSLGYKLFNEDKMGEEGRFIFGIAPWIDFQYKNHMKLPKDTNFVTEAFINDYSTDPRISLDMYKSMNVNHKTFIMLKKDSNHRTPFYEHPKDLIEKGIYEPLENLALFTFFNKNKEKIFSKKDIKTAYVNIEADGTLPSNHDYQSMLNKFKSSRSSFGCIPTKNYAVNPRENECLNYINE